MSLIIAALLVVMLVCSSDELAVVPSGFFRLQGGDSVEDDVFAVSSCRSIDEKFLRSSSLPGSAVCLEKVLKVSCWGQLPKVCIHQEALNFPD